MWFNMRTAPAAGTIEMRAPGKGDTMRSHIVIGHHGEVGAALFEVLSVRNPRGDEVLGIDAHQSLPQRPDGPLTMHVAIGWSENFVGAVNGYVHLLEPELVVVHSTVPVGTCDANGWIHSPIRGRHPHLTEGITTFTKHFAGARAAEAAQIFADRNITTRVHAVAATTELGKLTELVSYGVEIAMMQRIHALCVAHNVPFREAYTAMADTYNRGYQRLGHPHFTKPILDYQPSTSGRDEIGGHCIKQAGVAMIGAEFFGGLLDPLQIHDYARSPEPERLPGEVPLW
jgi:hypothetical protein